MRTKNRRRALSAPSGFPSGLSSLEHAASDAKHCGLYLD